ncbi:MAG: immunoglobulin domain-containing protein [Verrucomicrobiae bacterium]|nr:immunoglobulin domain-containing protein [Verrucomicrobiae bacterium]
MKAYFKDLPNTLFLVGTSLMGVFGNAQDPLTTVSISPSIPASEGGIVKVVEGEGLSLRAIHNGHSTAFLWRKDGVFLTGATERTFFLSHVQTADSGSYSVEVIAGNTPVESAPVHVRVVEGFRLDQSPPGSVPVNTDVQLDLVLATEGMPSEITWFHNGSQLSDSKHPKIVVSKATFAAAGVYQARAYHPTVGRLVYSPSVRLRVYAQLNPAEIVVQPQQQTATRGGSAIFTVGVSGSPPFRYQWQKGGSNINGATNFFLRLNDLEPTDAVSYRCVVAGVVGPAAVTLPAILTLKPPTISSEIADRLVMSGRAALAQRTNPGLTAATTTFLTALQVDPDHEAGNIFFAASRIADIVNHRSANDLLDRLGVAKAKRNLYHWDAGPSRDKDGNLIAPVGTDSAEVIAFARTNLLLELQGALTNLSQAADADLAIMVTKNESLLDDVIVDQGDIQLVRAVLCLAEYFIRTTYSWNLSTQLSDLADLKRSDSLTVEKLMAGYPQLLTMANSGEVVPAITALETAIDSYVQGAGIIRSRPAGLTRLFNVDREDEDSEERFRQGLIDLKASLSGLITVAERPEFQVNLGRLLGETNGPHGLLPAFEGNIPDPATLPNPNFSDSIQSRGAPIILMQPVGRSGHELGVFAVGQPPLTFQWQMNGSTIPGATNPILTLPFVPNKKTNEIQVVVSNSLGVVASRVVLASLAGGSLSWNITLAAENSFGLLLSGPTGLRVIIETSNDLRTWRPAVTNDMPADGRLSLLPALIVEPRRFFRATVE